VVGGPGIFHVTKSDASGSLRSRMREEAKKKPRRRELRHKFP
jgi:hypothetical protein